MATGTETGTTLVTGIDDVANRGGHVPDGAWVKYFRVNISCTTIPAAITRFQMGLFLAKGAMSFSNPIGNWFATTDPVTEAMIESRQYVKSRIVDVTKPASDFTAFKTSLVCKKPFKMRDGDDLQLWILHDAGGNLDFQTNSKLLYKSM